jgi:glycosyltransferase involved in cell wall biosynthesis
MRRTEPIPVLFVDHAPALGGGQRSLLLILKHLDRRRWQPYLAGSQGELLVHAAPICAGVYTLPLPRLRGSALFWWDLASGARALARLAGELGADLLHANTVRAAVYTRLAAPLAHRPWVWHMRDFWLTETEPSLRLGDAIGKRWLCGGAKALVAISQSVAAQLPCAEKRRVILNGIEPQAYDPSLDGGAFRRANGIALDAPLVGMVGRLRPWKGGMSFLQAAARVLARLPAAHFLVVGGDPFQTGEDYAQDLRRASDQLKLGARVTFTGHLADVRPALAAMDVFVHPGDPEPFGLVNLEAMAMGLPVVAWAHGALPEIVIPGETGALIPPGDLDGMAVQVCRLLEDPNKARTWGAAGRRRVQAHFDVRRTCREIEQLYEQLV